MFRTLAKVEKLPQWENFSLGEGTPLLSPAKSQAMLASALPDDDKLTPEEEQDLQDAAAKYHDEGSPIGVCAAPLNNKEPPTPFRAPLSPLHCDKLFRRLPPRPPLPMTLAQQKVHRTSGFLAALRQAEQAGDIEFAQCFPVMYGGEFDEEISWEPLPYKILKELKAACQDYGPLAPYTLTLLDTLSNRWMAPYDWVQVAKACLSGGNYLLWRAEYEELAKRQVSMKRKSKDAPMTLDMLLGRGEYNTAWCQMYLDKDILA